MASNNNNNSDIRWARENTVVGQARRGRKANDIWDFFNKYFLVPYYISTDEHVPANIAKSKPKSECNQCMVDNISAVFETMCNHLINCPSADDNTKNRYKEKKQSRKRSKTSAAAPANILNLPLVDPSANNYNNHNGIPINNNYNNNINDISSMNNLLDNNGLPSQPDMNSINQVGSRYTRFVDRNNVDNQHVSRGLGIAATQAVDEAIAEWVINRPHIPFTEPTNPYFLKAITILAPTYIPPSRQRISGPLATHYESKLKQETKQKIAECAIQHWGFSYDGSGDRCAEKHVAMTAANPKPIVVGIEPHTHTGEYNAHDHFLQMESMAQKFLNDNPNTKQHMIMTDCEPTMMAAKREYHEEHPEVFCPGCGIHCLSNHIKIGIFGIFVGVKKDLSTTQCMLKNTKVREGYTEEVVGDADKRAGLDDPGDTRWGSKDDQIQNMLGKKELIVRISNSNKYKQYAGDGLKVVNNDVYWGQLKVVGDIVHVVRYSIDYGHGIEILSATYYSFKLIFVFYRKQLNYWIEELEEKDIYDSDDYNDYGYDAETIVIETSKLDDENPVDSPKTMIKVYKRLQINLKHYWKLCNEQADDCFLIGFMFDPRFVNKKPMSGDKQRFKDRIEILYKNDHPIMAQDVLNENVGKLHKFTRDFRKKRGLFASVWKFYPNVNEHSTYDITLTFMDDVKDRYEDDKLLQWWCGQGEIVGSMLGTQGKLEAHFNPLKSFHNPSRGAMGPNKLRKMYYCYNQQRNIDRFKPGWKPTPKKKNISEQQSQ